MQFCDIGDLHAFSTGLSSSSIMSCTRFMLSAEAKMGRAVVARIRLGDYGLALLSGIGRLLRLSRNAASLHLDRSLGPALLKIILGLRESGTSWTTSSTGATTAAAKIHEDLTTSHQGQTGHPFPVGHPRCSAASLRVG